MLNCFTRTFTLLKIVNIVVRDYIHRKKYFISCAKRYLLLFSVDRHIFTVCRVKAEYIYSCYLHIFTYYSAEPDRVNKTDRYPGSDGQ